MTRNPIRRAALTALTAVALISSVAQAHQVVPEGACTAPSAQPSIVTTFKFNAQQLASYGNARIDNPSVCTQPGTCGIVDHWHFTLMATGQYCALWANNPDMTSPPFPIITAPASFNSDLHHEEYALVEGAEGICIVCLDDGTASQ